MHRLKNILVLLSLILDLLVQTAWVKILVISQPQPVSPQKYLSAPDGVINEHPCRHK